MIRLIYVSRASRSVDLHALLAQSQHRNEQAGLTGGLAYLNGVYLQYLEGPSDAVEDLFGRLQADARHKDLKLLEHRGITHRMFSTWSMGMLSWVPETESIFRAFCPGSSLDLYDVDPTTAAPLFRAWAKTRHWSENVVGITVRAYD